MKTRQLLRVLLPSWRFFDDVLTVPDLRYRVRADGVWSQWQTALPAVDRPWHSLVFNAEDSFRYAAQTLVVQLVQDLEHLSQYAADLTTYKLVRVLVKRRVLEERISATGARSTHFQFAVMIRPVSDDDEAKMPTQELLISPEYEV